MEMIVNAKEAISKVSLMMCDHLERLANGGGGPGVD